MTFTDPVYQGDITALQNLTPARRAEFEIWMKALDEAHVAAGSPYGEGSLWKLTGAECWLSAFEDGDDPSDALDEDLSNSD
jgi:hypothetical protein